ncbi:ribonuclease Oy-like [Saccostrea cucullata]|uniref:ribonuclease Oy-like n=1 Tax=Saccostrea cuccullata TaxID=36930 RepID=UPI002ED31B00
MTSLISSSHFGVFFSLIVWRSDYSHVVAIGFDHFVLAFRWPVTFCENNACAKLPPDFWTIHGLWPSKFNGNRVAYCSNITFNENNIPQKTLEPMNKIYPNLYDTQSNVNFWSQQWRKHGTCANVTGTRNVSEYFTKVINLASMYNIDQILTDYNITKGNTFKIKVIEDGIKFKTNHLPSIQTTAGQKPCWLFEIRLCFNTTFNQIDCRKKKSPCTRGVLYPRQTQVKETSAHYRSSEVWATSLFSFVSFLSILNGIIGQL